MVQSSVSHREARLGGLKRGFARIHMHTYKGGGAAIVSCRSETGYNLYKLFRDRKMGRKATQAITRTPLPPYTSFDHCVRVW